MAERVEYIEVDQKAIKKKTKYNIFMDFINFINAISKVSLVIGGFLFVFNIPFFNLPIQVKSIFSNLAIIYLCTLLILLIHTVVNIKSFVKK